MENSKSIREIYFCKNTQIDFSSSFVTDLLDLTLNSTWGHYHTVSCLVLYCMFAYKNISITFVWKCILLSIDPVNSDVVKIPPTEIKVWRWLHHYLSCFWSIRELVVYPLLYIVDFFLDLFKLFLLCHYSTVLVYFILYL